jgi:hypothetical protein
MESKTVAPRGTTPAAPPPAGVDRCANCDAPRSGPFCSTCGQPSRAGRLTARALTGHFAEAFDLDRGVLATPLALFRRPGRVIRDYLRGRTLPYTNPVKHLALVLSLVQLSALAAGATGAFTSGLVEGSAAADPARVQQATSTLDRFFVLLAAPAVPLLAAVQRLVFYRAGLTYAEHLAFALFVAGQQLLLFLPSLLVTGYRGPYALGASVLLAGLFGSVLYYAWAAHGVFGGRAAGALGRSAAVLALTGTLYLAMLVLALHALVL